MRALVAITLILCGTALVLAPAGLSFLNQFNTARLMVERKDLMNVSLDKATMEPLYQFVCCIMGGAMIGVGTIGGLRGGPCPPARDFRNANPGSRD